MNIKLLKTDPKEAEFSQFENAFKKVFIEIILWKVNYSDGNFSVTNENFRQLMTTREKNETKNLKNFILNKGKLSLMFHKKYN